MWGPKTVLGPLDFGPKNLKSKKNCGPKKLGKNRISCSTNILGQKNLLDKNKISCTNSFLSANKF